MASTALVHTTIHGFSTAAAGVGGGLAKLPGADAPTLMALQGAMLRTLAHLHRVDLDYAELGELLITLSASMAGRFAAARAARFLPGAGEAVNAAVAAAVTESVGWAAVAYFRALAEA